MYDYCISFLADYVTSCLECIFSKKEGNKFRRKHPNLFDVHAIIFNYQFLLNILTTLIKQIFETNRNM